MRLAVVFAVLAASFAAVPTLAGPPLRINFQNGSSATITKLYVRISGAKDWGTNRVPRGGLAPHGRQWVLLEDGADKCVTDLALTTDTGKTFGRQVNFCQSPNFTYHGD